MNLFYERDFELYSSQLTLYYRVWVIQNCDLHIFKFHRSDYKLNKWIHSLENITETPINHSLSINQSKSPRNATHTSILRKKKRKKFLLHKIFIGYITHKKCERFLHFTSRWQTTWSGSALNIKSTSPRISRSAYFKRVFIGSALLLEMGSTPAKFHTFVAQFTEVLLPQGEDGYTVI